jgi:hypothetical protein
MDEWARNRMAELQAAGRKKGKSEWKRYFTLFPYTWQERLQRCKAAGSAYRVALHLLYEHWRTDGQRIRLSNVAMAAAGVGSNAKWSGLLVLERAGLVQVERRPKKSPLITCLLVDKHTPGTGK